MKGQPECGHEFAHLPQRLSADCGGAHHVYAQKYHSHPCNLSTFALANAGCLLQPVTVPTICATSTSNLKGQYVQPS
jgi:hypothetical protein